MFVQQWLEGQYCHISYIKIVYIVFLKKLAIILEQSFSIVENHKFFIYFN